MPLAQSVFALDLIDFDIKGLKKVKVEDLKFSKATKGPKPFSPEAVVQVMEVLKHERLHKPIEVDSNLKVLDGRHRAQALYQLGVLETYVKVVNPER
jgi:ParB-like chromosome segregation protein Spo0J